MNKDWDSPIDEEGIVGSILPKGEYLFMVKSMTKGVSKGEKTAGAPQAKLVLQIYDKEDMELRKPIGIAFDRLTLHDSTWGLVCQFFVAIGERKHGETIDARWDMVPGAAGRVILEPHTFDGKDSMQVKQYLDPIPKAQPEEQAPTSEKDDLKF
jgi:hypothetical protein